jgi:hypothetical protein
MLLCRASGASSARTIKACAASRDDIVQGVPNHVCEVGGHKEWHKKIKSDG